MSSGIELRATLQGVAELDKRLAALSNVVGVSIMRSAVRAGIKPALDQAIALAPISPKEYRLRNHLLVAPGYGARAIRVTTKVEKDGALVTASLGVSKSAFFMVQFVERGTQKMTAKKWLVPAFAGTRPQMEAALAAKLKQRVDKATQGG